MSQKAIAGPAGTPPKRRRRRRRPGIGRFVFLGAFLIFVLGPLYWMFITSIKPSDDYLAVPPVWFPSHPTLVHYIAALFAYRGLQGIANSLIVSISATALSALSPPAPPPPSTASRSSPRTSRTTRPTSP